MLASSPAMRGYTRRVLILSLLYAACLFAAVYLFKHRLLGGALAGLWRSRPRCR